MGKINFIIEMKKILVTILLSICVSKALQAQYGWNTYYKERSNGLDTNGNPKLDSNGNPRGNNLIGGMSDSYTVGNRPSGGSSCSSCTGGISSSSSDYTGGSNKFYNTVENMIDRYIFNS